MSAFVEELMMALAAPLETWVSEEESAGAFNPEFSPLLLEDVKGVKLVVRVSTENSVSTPDSIVMSSVPITPVSSALPEDKLVNSPVDEELAPEKPAAVPDPLARTLSILALV